MRKAVLLGHVCIDNPASDDNIEWARLTMQDLGHGKDLIGNVQFESLGYISHRESVALMESADSLLLLIPEIAENKGILTGKIFEYIGSGLPVWGFGPTDGDAQDILHKCEAGSLHEDSKTAIKALEEYIDKRPKGAPINHRTKYTREGLAQKILERILRDIKKNEALG